MYSRIVIYCVMCVFMFFYMSLFFFFKQKTAYDMRISDWSSDVCSSDLGQAGQYLQHHARADDQRQPCAGVRLSRPGRLDRRDGAVPVLLVDREPAGQGSGADALRGAERADQQIGRAS